MTKEYTPDTIHYYDKIADRYLTSGAGCVVEDKIGQFTEYLPKGALILDVACGPGHDTNFLTKNGYRCVGVDLSGEMLRIAKDKHKGHFVQMDFFNLGFFDDSFDAIWFSSGLVHTAKEDLPELLSEFKRVLKKDGILGVITVAEQKISRSPEDTRAYIMYRDDELKEILTSFGFSILDSNIFLYGGKDRLFMIARNS